MKTSFLAFLLAAFVSAAAVQSASLPSNSFGKGAEKAASEFNHLGASASAFQSEIDDLTKDLAQLRGINTGRANKASEALEKSPPAPRHAYTQRKEDPWAAFALSGKRWRNVETPSASSSRKKFQG